MSDELPQKTALLTGAGGFICSHLAKDLKKRGYWIRGVDLKYPEYDETACDEFIIGDLRNKDICKKVFELHNGQLWDEAYFLAADMGGALFCFTGDNDANITSNNALININCANESVNKVKKIFFSSSACIYPERTQDRLDSAAQKESNAWDGAPDSPYGIEKLFSECLYQSFHKNHNIDLRIVRFHNIFGPYGTWCGGREKAPAAICRKVIESKDGYIDVFGDGEQRRSFLYIDECLKGIRKIMDSSITVPINLGSDEQVSINELVSMAASVENKRIIINNINSTALGVRGRCSDNTKIKELLYWAPDYSLLKGLVTTYNWIKEQVVHES